MASRKAKQTIFVVVILLMVVSTLAAYKMYTKPHRTVESEKALAITAIELFKDFERNEPEANTKYLDKVLEVTGKISEVEVNMDNRPIIILETSNIMFGIRCTIEDSTINIKPGATVTLKGICTGYLSDVVITNGLIKK